MTKQNWRKLNWRKFLRRITWVLSCIAAVVCAGVRQDEIGWEYPLLRTIPQMLLFTVIGFASTWVSYYIIWGLSAIVKRIALFIWAGLHENGNADEE